MEVTFKDRKLERIIDDPRKLKKRFNEKVAKIIEKRINFLEEVENLGKIPTFPPTRLHLLKGDLKGKYAIDVTSQLRIVFEINQDPIPYRSDNSVDIDQVTKISVIGIYDYH